MLRSVLAVLAGFATTAVLVLSTDQLMARLLPAWFPTPVPGSQPPPAGLALNLAYATVYAVIGGYVMASVTRREVMKHLYWLLGLMVLFGIASAAMAAGLLPLWYSLLVVVCGMAGYYVGARLYLQRHERAEMAQLP